MIEDDSSTATLKVGYGPYPSQNSSMHSLFQLQLCYPQGKCEHSCKELVESVQETSSNQKSS